MIRIEDLLTRQANNNTAIKYSNLSLSFKEWNKESRALSEIIDSLLDVTSKQIGIYLPNSISYAIAYFGILFSNKVIIPIGIQAKFPEIFRTLAYCEVDMLITESKHVKEITDNYMEYNYRLTIYVMDTKEIIILNRQNKLSDKSEYLVFDGSDDDVAIMLHTSGSTSNPKRVMLTHKNLIKNIESNIESLKLTSSDRALIALPMFFGYCNTAQFLTHLYLGATQIIMDAMFMPKKFFEIVTSERITNFTAVPTMLLMLENYKFAEKYDYSSLRFICFGGGRMPKNKLKKIIKKYSKIGFIQTYGQTECSPRVTALLPENSLRKLGSVGKPIPDVSIEIISEDGKICGQFQTGEVMVSGENLMKGYYKDKKLTNQTICDGWIHTGDLGYIDDEGYLYISGRMKNIIISGGINIYPEEIEEVLLTIDGIEDAYVYGIEHEMLGEIPVAQIILKDKTKVLSDIKEYCKKKLSNYKIPKVIQVVNSIEKTYNGKIKRF